MTISIGDPGGGGYVMIMGYTGWRWARLWEGNGSTQNPESLPARSVICMDRGGWTNLRKGPGVHYPRVGKVSTPTPKRVFEARLTKAMGKTPGEAWLRIVHNGRPAWVQNLRTVQAGYLGLTPVQACADWRRY